MRLQITKSKNSESFYAIESFRENGKNTSRVYEKLGTLEEVREKANGQDPYEWAKQYVADLTEKKKNKTQEILVPFHPSELIPLNDTRKYNIGFLFLQQIYYKLGLKEICNAIKRRNEFDYDINSILSRLVYCRIINPASKLGTYEFSQKLIEAPEFELHQVYRALDVLNKEMDYILSTLYKNSENVVSRDKTVLYYDCTNYFFEIEEECGLRQYGKSKENRPNPIVEMGLFIDGNGIPLSFNIHGGATNEQITMKPLEKKILEEFGLANFIVCTDSALSSGDNKFYNTQGDRNFITATSLKKMKEERRKKFMTSSDWYLVGDVKKTKYDIADIEKDPEKYEEYYEKTFYKEEWFIDQEDVFDEVLNKKVKRDVKQRLIVTFSFKYKAYLENIRDKQIERALKLIKNGDSGVNKKRDGDPKKYILQINSTDEGVVAENKTFALDEAAIATEAMYDGYYAVYTSLPGDKFPITKIIAINHGRWEIEECFKIMKTDFEARPVYLQKEERIQAHFLTCFIALLILRVLEFKTEHNFTYPDLISTLEDMDLCRITGNQYVPAYTRTATTDKLHDVFGFRTDYTIMSQADVKKIIYSTKKGIYYDTQKTQKRPEST